VITRFASADFLGSNGSERLKKCHEMAKEAAELAAQATSEKQRASYLDLVRQWRLLAEEIARAEDPAAGTRDSESST
jgi:hypothetical protein